MSVITSLPSSSKPSDPIPGSMFYFTDTNQIAVYEGGGTYQVYSKDTVLYSLGGEEELSYSGGIYNDPSAQYYISQSPNAHLDINYLDGAEKTPWLHEDGSAITNYHLWYESNGYDRTAPQTGNKVEGWHSRSSLTSNSYVSNLHQGRSYLYKGRGTKVNYPTYYSMSSLPSTSSGDFTQIFVQSSGQGSACASAYSSATSSLFFINSQTQANVGSYKGLHLAGATRTTTDGRDTATMDSVEVGVPTDHKNAIFVIKRKDGVIKYYGSAVPGSPISQGDRRGPLIEWTGSPTSSFSSQRFSNITSGVTYNSNTYVAEYLSWNEALDQDDLDKTYLYLLNKYTFYNSGENSMQSVRNDGTVGSVDLLDPTTYNLLQE
jgi:hypothetical protein